MAFQRSGVAEVDHPIEVARNGHGLLGAAWLAEPNALLRDHRPEAFGGVGHDGGL